MNRRRVLNTVHRSLARVPLLAPDRGGRPLPSTDHTTVERMSIRDLDRLGPKLLPPTDPRQPDEGEK